MEELDLSYFELNLETWRQLWRVLEMSDVLLIIVDIRYPVLMFPPYLYDYVTNTLQKDMILVLNKIDLAPASLVVAWKDYFRNQYPKLHILMFTSYPAYNLHGNVSNEGKKVGRRKGKLRMAAEGAQKLLQACKDIVGDKVDLSSWHEKIQEEMHLEYDLDLDDIDHKDTVTIEKEDTTYFQHEKYKNGVLTIGCIGTPNVGKSSLMNALMGTLDLNINLLACVISLYILNINVDCLILKFNVSLFCRQESCERISHTWSHKTLSNHLSYKDCVLVRLSRLSVSLNRPETITDTDGLISNRSGQRTVYDCQVYG